MNYEKLDYVIAVAEEQNLTKAAERLFISQPALTSALNKLDAEFGVKLFDRKRPPMKLTAAGMLYVQEMTKIRQLQMNMQTRLRESLGIQLRLGIGTGRGFYWLPILLPAFQSLHPEVQVILPKTTFLNYGSNLLGNGTDIAIGTLGVSAPNITEEVLVRENLLYVVPKALGIISEEEYQGHSLSAPLVIQSALLDGQPFVCPESSTSYPHYIETEMNRWRYRHGSLTIYGTPQAALHLAAGGMGCTFIPQQMCQWERIEERYSVYFCTLSPQPVTQAIRVSYLTDNPHRELIEDMIRVVREKVLAQLYGE